MVYKRIIMIILFIFLFTLSFSACNSISTSKEPTKNESSDESVNSKISYSVEYDSDDESTDMGDSVTNIVFEGDSVSIDGNGAKETDGAVMISTSGSYNISGSDNDNQIIIYVEDEGVVKLFLDGLNLTSKKSSPIYVMESNKTVITLVEGSKNKLTDNEKYELNDKESDEPNSAIYSKDDLTINGKGSLSINANYKHGIKCNDELKILSGNINISAASNGIRGKDFTAIKSADITIESEGDGIKSNNEEKEDEGFVLVEDSTLNITSETDVIQAVTGISLIDSELEGKAGGGSENAPIDNRGNDDWKMFKESKNSENTGTAESKEDTEDTEASSSGLTAEVDITLKNSNIVLDSSGDAIHSNNNFTLDSGKISLSAGDDGIHADTVLEINDGELEVVESYEAIEAAQITMNDGNVILYGSDDGVNGSGGSDNKMFGRPGGNMRDDMGNRNNEKSQENQTQSEGKEQDQERPERDIRAEQEKTQSENAGDSSNEEEVEVSFVVNGGYLYVESDGDGIDIGGTVEINDGTVIVNGPTSGMNGALDADSYITVNGGFLVAAGSSEMAEVPDSSSKQNSVSMTFESKLSAETLVHIETTTGENIITFSPLKEFQNIVISSPDLDTGESYILYSGGKVSGDEKNGLYSGAEYEVGTEEEEFTISDVVTTFGSSNRGFGRNGGRGGFKTEDQKLPIE